MATTKKAVAKKAAPKKEAVKKAAPKKAAPKKEAVKKAAPKKAAANDVHPLINIWSNPELVHEKLLLLKTTHDLKADHIK